MKIVTKINAETWVFLSENAHKICFNEIKKASLDRIDFALIVAEDDNVNTPLGYLTCREFDAETLYIQFGGSFPGTRGTIKSWDCYVQLHKWISAKYKRCTTLIENENVVMLKFAMKLGYRIIGIRNFKNSILLEHLLEFNGSDYGTTGINGDIGSGGSGQIGISRSQT